MKGFVHIGNGNFINKDYIDKEKTCFDKEREKWVVVDIYGNKYYTEYNTLKGVKL